MYTVYDANTPEIHPIEKLTFLSTNPNKTKTSIRFRTARYQESEVLDLVDFGGVAFSWKVSSKADVWDMWRECVLKWLMSWLKMIIELTCTDYTVDLGRLGNSCILTLELTFETQSQGNPSSNDYASHVWDISRRDTGFWSVTREKACSHQYTPHLSIHLTWHDYQRDLLLNNFLLNNFLLNNHYSPDFWYLHTFISAYMFKHPAHHDWRIRNVESSLWLTQTIQHTLQHMMQHTLQHIMQHTLQHTLYTPH